MGRRFRWIALALGLGVATVGAAITYLLTGGRWAWAGAIMGAVAGSFAPSVSDGVRKRNARKKDLQGIFEKAPPQSWARLLDPRRMVVDFIGREDELRILKAWCEDEHSGRLRLVTGPGGVGKTRLTVELGECMERHGWKSERIATGQEATAIPALRAVTHIQTLLVVDYAETRAGLGQMLNALASDQGKRTRVLLVARSTGDWWNQLGTGEPAVWDMVQEAKQAELSLSSAVARDLPEAAVIAAAVTSFAQELGAPERVVEVYGESSTVRRRVLDLHAAALVAVLAEPGHELVRVDIRTVLSELLRHEQHFWYHSAHAYGLTEGRSGTSLAELGQIVAAASLLGAASKEEARILPGRVPGLSPSGKIADWLRVLYPPDSKTDWIGSLQPDRLAELHTLQELAAAPELAHSCLTRLDSRQALKAVTLLARASSDYPEATALLGDTLPDVVDLIADMQGPAETLTTIFNAIPYPTVVLAPAALTLGQRIMSDLPGSTEPGVRAHWLATLSLRLNEHGRPADALPAAEEAVTIYRELSVVDPDRYSPELAQSLNNLGPTFSLLDRLPEAMAATREALAIRRDLAAANPYLHRRDLAQSLHSLGTRFSELGRPAEALRVEEEALAIRRELAAANLDQHRWYLTRPRTGQSEAPPVPQGGEAPRWYLSPPSPDLYHADLAATLHSLGITFSKLGRPAEALPVEQEALSLRRELAAANPDQHRRDLARSLHSLGITFSELGRPAEALTVTEEAVELRRKLAAANPDQHRRDLAQSLHDLGITFSELGRPAEALTVTEEAVELRRKLAAANPDQHRPDLAQSLHDLGITFSELGRPAEALTVTEEAVELRRKLAAANPDQHRPDLAQSLILIAAIHDELGHKTAADSWRAEAAALSEPSV